MIEEVGQIIPKGMLTWCCPGDVSLKDSSLLDLIIPRVFVVVDHGLYQ